MFSSLKFRDFRVFWFAMLISLVGTWVQSMAQSWLIFKLTRSVFLLGLVGFLNFLPILLFSLPAGVFVDRHSRKNLLIVTQTIFMLLAFILAVLVDKNVVTVWEILIIAFLNGIVLSIDAPARQAMVVEMVGKRHLYNAIALNSAAFNSARIIGPALAGILIVAVALKGCFYVNAFSFLPVIAALFVIRPHSTVFSIKKNSVFKDAVDALHLVKRSRFLTGLLAMVGIMSIFGSSYVVLMPVFAQEIFHEGAKGLAVLMSANGIGALIGALSIARLKESESKLKVLKISVLLFFGAIMLFSLSASMVVASFLLVLAGFAGSRCTSTVNTMLQMSIPDHFRGRLMSIFVMVFTGFVPFGSLVSGSLAHFFGARMVVFGGAFLSLILSVPFAKKYLFDEPAMPAHESSVGKEVFL